MLEKIWSDWEAFASYAFNKSHAACYSWVAFQTAYLKANYPAEFMAAIMSRRRDQITEITKLMDECKAMKIATKGPDVNESYQMFGVNHHGEIRFGLAAIKGMGDSVAEAIIQERERGGLYKDIFDFVQRVNLSAVNRKAFESLALSGAFDSFGIRREDFFVTNSKRETFIETLLRYGNNYQAEQQEMKNSLFGGENAVEIARPAVPKGEPWSDIERLNKERELVGIYLSAHPLDNYRIVLDHLCNTRAEELADVQSINDREEIVIGAIVTQVQSKFTKTGKPCGFVTLEDFHGSGELALFGEEWARWNSWFTQNASLCIKGRMVQRWQNSPQKDLRIEKIEYLQTVKENAIDHLTIMLNVESLNEEVVNELSSIVEEHPGRSTLFFQLHDAKTKHSVLLKSQQQPVDVCMPLLQFIDQTEGMEYHIN